MQPIFMNNVLIFHTHTCAHLHTHTHTQILDVDMLPLLCLTDFPVISTEIHTVQVVLIMLLPPHNTEFREISPKRQKVAASDHFELTNQLCFAERLLLDALLKMFMQGTIQRMALNDLFSNTILMKNDLSE